MASMPDHNDMSPDVRVFSVDKANLVRGRQSLRDALIEGNVSLVVTDVPFDCGFTKSYVFRPGFGTALAGLPPHQHRTLRLLEYTVCGPSYQALENHIHTSYGDVVRRALEENPEEDVMWDVGKVFRSREAGIDCWLRTSRYELHSDTDESLMSRFSALKLLSLEDDKLLVFHRHPHKGVNTNELFVDMASIALELPPLLTMPFTREGSQEELVSRIVLAFFTAILRGCLKDVENDRKTLWLSSNTYDTFLSLATAQLFQTANRVTRLMVNKHLVAELSAAIEFVLSDHASYPEAVSSTQCRYIRWDCARLERMLGRINERHEQWTELARTHVQARESATIRYLTTIATIFLPVTVATSLLGMQTRFKELHMLLYDFLGVSLLAFTMAMLLPWVVRFFVKLSGPVKIVVSSITPGSVTPEGRQWRGWMPWAAIILWSWIAMTISLLYGMLHGPVPGIIVFGYCMAANVVIFVASVFEKRVLNVWKWRRKVRKEVQHRNNQPA